MLGNLLLFGLASFLTFLFLLPLNHLFKAWHWFQYVRVEGPAEHLKKQGTLTFGGVAILSSILVLAIIFLDLDINFRLTALIWLMLLFGAIGFFDDYLKKIKGHNEGLAPRQKFGLQCLVALIFALSNLALAGSFGFWPIVTGVPFAVLVIVGASNAANLTDGLDGLLAGVAGVAFLSLAGLAQKAGQPEFAMASIICAGATLGFLSFNLKPAKIFMGDVGSLAIGALLGGLAVLLHKEWWLGLIGGVLVAETVSVIIQVGVYKIWRRRIFKMSPLHHHFELSGFSELEVVLMFWLAAIIFGITGYLLG